MTAPVIQTAFSSGELAPSLWGHVDLDKFHTAASTMRNMFVGFRGGAYSRAGTKIVGISKQPVGSRPRLITWTFSQAQAFALEFGQQYIRFIFGGSYVVESGIGITGISTANPCVITTASPHGYTTGDGVFLFLTGVAGPALQLNSNQYNIIVTGASTFQIVDPLTGAAIDSSTFPAFAGTGTVNRIYTIASPYAAADLPLLKFAQSADVMSLTHPNYPPQDLKRMSNTNWTLTPTTFASPIAAPTTATAAATTTPPVTTPPTKPAGYAYQVTAVDKVTGQESQPSNVAVSTNGVDMAATIGSEVINWLPSAGAQFYQIYRAPTSYNTGNATNALPPPVGSLFGVVGQSFGTQFVDTNITPDFSITPPQHRAPFAPGQILFISMTASSSDWTTATIGATTSTGSGLVAQAVITAGVIVAAVVVNPGQGYLPGDTPTFAGDGTSAAGTFSVSPLTGMNPGVVSYFQQRRVYASTLNEPDKLFASRTGSFTNFDVSIPVADSDAITATPWSEKVDGIQWMVSTSFGMLAFTGSAIWNVGAPGSFGVNQQPITQANILAAPQSAVGCSATVGPLRVNWDFLYVQSQGYSVRDLTYQIYFNIYAGTDISWPSSHLLTSYQITDWCYAEEPFRIIWAVRNDGVLLSLTYLKEQQIAGWARHDTMGQVKSVCAVSEPPLDILYMVVERPLATGGTGATAYFIEQMQLRFWRSIEETWAVDAAVESPLTRPAGALYADSAVGAVNFVSLPGAFTSGMVGQILRSGGGIARITAFTSSSQMAGTWVLPCQQIYPNDPKNRPLPQPAGNWAISPQVTVVGGLPHLEGQQVMGIADGVPIGPLTVSPFGIVTLPFPASWIKIGLGYTAQLQSVYFDTGQPTIQGRRKAVYAVTVRSEASVPCQAGANQTDASAVTPTPLFEMWNLPRPGMANVSPAPPPTYTSPGGQTVQPMYTGDQRILIPSAWQKPGQVAVQQTQPLPLTVTAFIPELLPGDEPEAAIAQRPQQQRRAA